jgi:hypothetical protein
MGDKGESLPYKMLMGVSGAAALGSAGVLAVANGHLEGLAYVDQVHQALPTDALFMNPEQSGGADSIREHVIGNIDTAAHFLAAAGISGAANKVLEPGTRAKAAAAGLASGAIGYTMLKDGMYEGAYNAIDISTDSLQAAAADGFDSLVGHVYDELGDVDYGPDMWRDFHADTAGVLAERSLSSDPPVEPEDDPGGADVDESYEELAATAEDLSDVDAALEPEAPVVSEDSSMEVAEDAAYNEEDAVYAEA